MSIDADGNMVGATLQHCPVDVWERAGDDAVLRSLSDRPVNPKFFRWVEKNRHYLLTKRGWGDRNE